MKKTNERWGRIRTRDAEENESEVRKNTNQGCGRKRIRSEEENESEVWKEYESEVRYDAYIFKIEWKKTNQRWVRKRIRSAEEKESETFIYQILASSKSFRVIWDSSSKTDLM